MKNSNKTNFERLKNMADEDIDYSDIEATDKNFWKDAEVFFPHKKIEVKFEIDEDIALWLSQFGNSSNIAVNNLLRAYFTNFTQLQKLT
jgi:uncharacterized protein (DUF4415 family)